MNQPHSHDHSHDASTNLGVAFLLNLLFTILEIAGGLWTNSIAILTDALHDGADCFSLGLAWYLQRISMRRPDALFTYGYRRFSSLGALITGLVLMVGLVVIGWNAFHRLRQPEEVNAQGMLGIAMLGIFLNGLAAWKLHGGHSLNEQIASWHLIEDVLGWVAVLIGSAIMSIWYVPIIDPILALFISLFVFWNVYRNLKKVVLIFLQSAPAGFDRHSFDREMAAIPNVVSSHHTHTWTLDGDRHVFSTHLVVKPGSSRDEILAVKRRVYGMLKDQHFEHITIDIELEGEICAIDELDEVHDGH